MEAIEYLGFEVEIGQGSNNEYPVRATSQAGQAYATMRLPFDAQALEGELEVLRAAMRPTDAGHRRKESRPEQQIQAFGQTLFDALFRNQIRVLYNSIRYQANEENKLFRLELRIEPQELAILPWESLYDRQLAEYICQTAPLVRHVTGPARDWPSIATPPLRILGVVANPGDGPPPDAEVEQQHLEEATSRLRALELVELEWVEGQRARDLVQALGRKEWHVLHFIGDGGLERKTGEGFVVVDDDAGQSRRLSASQLKWLLSKCKSLQLIWLMVCAGALGDRPDRFTATAALLVQEGIPAVLSAQLGTNSQATELFIEALYAALVAGMPLDLAVTKGRVAVQMDGSGTPAWSAPVVHTSVPDLQLFDRQTVIATAQHRGDEALFSDDFERALTQYVLAVEMGAGPDIQEKKELAESALGTIKTAEDTLNTPAAGAEAQTDAVASVTGDLEALEERLPASAAVQALLVRAREAIPSLRARLWQESLELLEVKAIGLTLEQRYRRMEDSVRLLQKAKGLTPGENPTLESDLAKAQRRLDYLQNAQERAQTEGGRRWLRYGIIIALIIAVLIALYFVFQMQPLSDLFGDAPTALPTMGTDTPGAVTTANPTALEEATYGSEVTPTALATVTANHTPGTDPTRSPPDMEAASPEPTATEAQTATPLPSDTTPRPPPTTASP